VVETPAVVCCAGPWSALIGAMVGLEIPIVPLRRQFFITGEFPYTPPDHPFTLEFATTLYFHPEANGLLVGMSNQDEKPGYNFAVDEEFRQKTIQRGVYRLPVLEHATIATEWVGLYEVTPDAHPILSASADLPGFYIAAGFSGHGVMHSPATGLVMSELILDGRAHSIDISMLDLERFREGRLVKEVNVI
jgi:sarcosine oxidase subunit beta